MPVISPSDGLGTLDRRLLGTNPLVEIDMGDLDDLLTGHDQVANLHLETFQPTCASGTYFRV